MSATLQRILVRAPNWLGDAVLSLGAVRDVRRCYPQARLEVLARPWVADLYRAVREVDGVRVCDSFRTGLAAARGFDAAILLPNSFASALQVRLAGVRERWGYARDGRGPLLTRRARVPEKARGRSEAFYYRAMLAALGLPVDPDSPPALGLVCPDEWRLQGAALLGAAGPWLGLNPGAAFGSAKRWFPERYAAAAASLAAQLGLRIVIVGSAAERATASEIARALPAGARVLAGETSLGDLVGVLSHLTLLLTNDSGPMHVAAALGIPLVAVFGPTDWSETAPVGEACRVVREPVECAPCKKRTCPIDHRCMERVTVETVVTASEALLKGRCHP